ncbi:MAG: hypothetical protein AAGF95_28300 [Chloroflexota bacterium]
MFTSRTRKVLRTQWLLCLGLVCMVCGCAWLPVDHEPLDFDSLTRGLPRDTNRIIEFQEIDDKFSVATYIGTFDWHPYPDLGCIIGTVSSEGMGHAPSMGTIDFEETRDLPAQPLVVLQNYFHKHHVACIFVTESGRALGGTSLELIDRQGEIQVWQFVQGHAVIVADGETPPDTAPFTEL